MFTKHHARRRRSGHIKGMRLSTKHEYSLPRGLEQLFSCLHESSELDDEDDDDDEEEEDEQEREEEEFEEQEEEDEVDEQESPPVFQNIQSSVNAWKERRAFLIKNSCRLSANNFN
ncbi:unnamed protein product [Schistocephalus solidus]|uniref:Protein phosphatase 1 regulatory subunit 15A-like n=1 Tax=Schistocephalus solidus TaxID=70667 RepID=A0A183THV4_SCHSO|nr:unnamed protein product [Schistocephalus solidus]